MSHRKGIVAKKTEKEETRRKEARENGIILEKAKMKKSIEGKRDRGVGAPGVGKFSGGTLNLSKKVLKRGCGSWSLSLSLRFFVIANFQREFMQLLSKGLRRLRVARAVSNCTDDATFV